jgi:hypothetical protein
MKQRAFTLLEVSVASTLGLLALLVLVWTLIPISRSSARTLEQLELSRLTHLASQRLLEDLQSAPPAAIGWPNQGYFSLHPLERTTASARPVFASSWIGYCTLDHSLRRKLVAPAGLPLYHGHIPALAEFTNAFASGGSKLLIAGWLHEFQLHRVGQRSLQLRLVLRSGQQSYAFDEVVALRNGLP